MFKSIKSNFFIIAGAVVLFTAALFIRDLNQLEAIRSLFRRKSVEDDVDIIKRKLATEQNNMDDNQDKLMRLAEELKRKKVDVSKASEEDIKRFYKDILK